MKIVKNFSNEGNEDAWETIRKYCPSFDKEEFEKREREHRERINQANENLKRVREERKKLEEDYQKETERINAKYDKLQRRLKLGITIGAITLPAGIAVYKHYKNRRKRKRDNNQE